MKLISETDASEAFLPPSAGALALQTFETRRLGLAWRMGQTEQKHRPRGNGPIVCFRQTPQGVPSRNPSHGSGLEDEIGSICSVIGAVWAGAKAMTATSGPGFSLMQETIGWGFMSETPCVIVDVQRAGPGTGQATKCGQGDVMQARWGTHGDFSAIALSPNSVQEMFELTIRAFNLAEKYRTPVILLADETIAHVREKLTLPPVEQIEIINRKKPKPGDKAFFGLEDAAPMPSVGEGFNVAVTASTHDEYGVRFTQDALVHRRIVTRLNAKINNHVDDIVEVENHNVGNCDIGVVSYGCTSRAVYEAVEQAEAKGTRIGHVRLKTIWPFPDKQVRQLAENAKRIVMITLNQSLISIFLLIFIKNRGFIDGNIL